ncbi:MAG TPA: L-seryl-tRNA(Sec) selenium transferase [Longimicrobiales bacterium]|nr:L-seryl-tRNA(Sec) selenium transferase [Longimicrobiales bacterium]
MTDPRRRIPSVDQLLASASLEGLIEEWGRPRVTGALRSVQASLRDALDRGEEHAGDVADPEWYAGRVRAALLAASTPSLRRAINATGVVLHTNLGRAPLGSAARAAIQEAAGYVTLEVDRETGGRGSRSDHCVHLLGELTGAEAALVVNNNAAALVLVVNTLAADLDVVVSRGELVEIGGSFRIAELIQASGGRLREVGATNRTHPRDYEAAIGADTGLLLRVHRSNFRVEGFTADVPADTLAGIAAAAGVPLVHDLGSGLLIDLAPFGIAGEPTAREALEEGADLVTMSGDKLLGGPQAGIILGRAALVERLRANPLSRALRPDKLTLAGLEATLALYRDPDLARAGLPALAMLTAPIEGLRRRAEGLAARLRATGVEADVLEGAAPAGGGALPGAELAAAVVAVRPGADGPDAAARRLRLGEPAILVRVREGRLLVDPRTVHADEEATLLEAVARAVGAGGAGAAGEPGADHDSEATAAASPSRRRRDGVE